MAIRMRRLAREEERLGEKLVPKLAPKVRRKEETRERKAEAAAKVERAIERELIERLRSGAYGDNPLNVEENIWKKVLKGLERQGEGVRDEDLDDGIEEEEEEIEGEAEVEYVSDLEGESADDLGDLEEWLGENSGESDDDENGEDKEDGSGSESGTGSEDEEDEGNLKETVAGMKRKRGSQPLAKPKKKGKKLLFFPIHHVY